MLHKTNGIVLRSVKYGETSIVTTIFTQLHGIQTYMVKGVRTASMRQNRAGMFQPGMLLEMVVYEQHHKNMQHIREYQPAYIYGSIQESVVKNSIVLFSVELLLRLLPEHAPLPQLFAMVFEYFTLLDKMPTDSVANFPLYFIIQCNRELGYELIGNYSEDTPYLNLQEGGFTEYAPAAMSVVYDDDARVLNRLLSVTDYDELKLIDMNADMRLRLIDWYIAFLQRHSQHMGNIRSLSVLRAILH